MCNCDELEDTKLEEAIRQRNLRIMQSETFKDIFQDSFNDLRRAIGKRDSEEVAVLVDYIESRTCNAVAQFDDAYQRAANTEKKLEQTKVKP